MWCHCGRRALALLIFVLVPLMSVEEPMCRTALVYVLTTKSNSMASSILGFRLPEYIYNSQNRHVAMRLTLRGGGDERDESELLQMEANKELMPSKRELKRQQKKRIYAERKLAQKNKEKEKRRQKQQLLREESSILITPAEKEEREAQARESYMERMRGRNEFASQRLNALAERGGQRQRVAIDLAYDHLMTQKEIGSLASQLSMCHSLNTKALVPLDLKIVGYNASSPQGAPLSKFNPEKWATSRAFGVAVTDQPLLGCYKNEELVYLSADAPTSIHHLDPSKVYVVGGIVDRNRHKGCSAARASNLGIAAAKLPVSEYIKLQAAQVLTVNQVVELLQQLCSNASWPRALAAVVPQRKRPCNSSATPLQPLCDNTAHVRGSAHMPGGSSIVSETAETAATALQQPCDIASRTRAREAVIQGGSSVVSSPCNMDVTYAFDVTDAADHAETPLQAYTDIAPVLHYLALALNKTAADLRIFDPYYCTGAVKRHLSTLGFTNVHNENEDFYEAVRTRNVPPYDVLVTNPPYSSDHIPRLFTWLTNATGTPSGLRPWLVLVPNFVYMKDFFQPILSGNSHIGESGEPKKKEKRNSKTEIIQKPQRRARSEVAFLTPARRYVYDNKVATKTCEVKVSKIQTHIKALAQAQAQLKLRTAPFVTFWHVQTVPVMATEQLLKWYNLNGTLASGCRLCLGTKHLEPHQRAQFDPLRKRLRKRQREQLRKKTTADGRPLCRVCGQICGKCRHTQKNEKQIV